MIQLLVDKYKRTIAFFLLLVIYIGFLSQLQVALAATNYGTTAIRTGGDWWRPVSANHRISTFADNVVPKSEQINTKSTVLANPVVKLSSAEVALDGGPGQPEASSFKSAGTDNLIDLFTGDFSYNIPLMDVGGYPVAIHYNSGISMDQEASWVGLGWNINPGTISRTMRGLPDDFNGTDLITKTESIKENKTVNVNGSVSLELVGLPNLDKLMKVGLNISAGLLYNNYMGWGVETAVSPSISSNLGGGKNSAGTLTGSLSISSNSMYGASISPSLSYNLSNKAKTTSGEVSIGTSYNNRYGMSALQMDMEVRRAPKDYKINDRNSLSFGTAAATFSSFISFAKPSYTPTISMPYHNESYSFTGRVAGEIWGLSPGFGISGSVQKQTVDPKPRFVPAYGYMHFTKAKVDPEGLMDFNREKELVFNSASTPHIAVPVYTPDIFSISGEGIGGMFRAYRSDLGYIRDHKMETSSDSRKLSVDLGGGGYLHVGADVMAVDAGTANRAWKNDNLLEPQLQFQQNDTTFESVYFKNPGEQTVVDYQFYDALGNDTLIRASLAGEGENVYLNNSFEMVKGGVNVGTLDVSQPIARKKRDKRTQVINYYTADQADKYGFDRKILSYPENLSTEPVVANTGGDINCLPGVTRIDRLTEMRRPNHISQIDVLGTDGRKYVYGIPVYNKYQADVTFAVNRSTTHADKGLIQYDEKDDSPDNNKGKDNYFSKEEIPGYAHSFLLTGIVSPDYVDIRQDGITDDDLGDAIRFNYSGVCGENNPFNWRIPYSNQERMANYNEGLKSYNRDDKGSYSFGEKELWYLHSIESKNFVAVFFVSKSRADLLKSKGYAGGLEDDPSSGPRKLDRIDLYSKADLAKNGANARPIKSVHFEYDYSLCPGIVGTGTGKLTLKAIRFSFNKGEKKNPYRFSYSSLNPPYNPALYDRWGNYKDLTENPASLSNYDYPYAVQDSVKAAANAGAWCLTDIQLPEGGKLKVTYEGDDYGFVQNKRATTFFPILGFAGSETGTPSKYIYGDDPQEKVYVFAQLPSAVNDLNELKERYFSGIRQLYFKLHIPMPATDKWGTGVGNEKEWIPMYTEIEEIGFAGTSRDRIWIKVKKVEDVSPFKKVAIQFLRLNLPSKAYPNSETGTDVNFDEMIKVIMSSFDQYFKMLTSFQTIAMQNNWCKEVDLGRTMVRLNEPNLKKYGGGHRVKRIELFDNWNGLTNNAEQGASYGQEYIYTTDEDLNGFSVSISSGVASFEPQIGGDENVFHIAKETKEKTNLLAPTNLMYAEEPLGESFFPSPMVGYSKVRVRSIHNNVRSANGFTEKEFFTAREFPTMVESTPLDSYGKKAFRSKLSELLKIDSRQFMNVSQGFKVELNNMHGKIKAESSYSQNDAEHPILTTRYFYKVDDPNASTKHLNNDVSIALANGEIRSGAIGKDIEVMIDLREQESKTTSLNLGANVDIVPGGVWPIPLPSAIPFPQREIMRFRSVAITKVVNRYAILDSIVQIDKGSVVSTKNMVWDAENGAIIMNRSNNEFNDPVYNLNYPAYWGYNGMGPAYDNIGIDLGDKQLKIVKGKLFNNDDKTVEELEKFFTSGDEIIVRRTFEEDIDAITPMGMQRMAAPIENDPELCGEPVWRKAINKFIKIWVVDASFGSEGHKGIYFIDQEGRPYSCKGISEFRVIRSGRRNLTASNAGSIVSLSNPVSNIGGVNKITVNTETKVLSATAATYKNLWKVVNHFYVKDTTERVERVMPAVTLKPYNTNVFRDNRDHNGYIRSEQVNNSEYLVSSFDYISGKREPCGRSSRSLYTYSDLYFDFSVLGDDPVIKSAKITFTPFIPKDVIYVAKEGKSGWPCKNERSTYDWRLNTSYYNTKVAAMYNNASIWNRKKSGSYPGSLVIGGPPVLVSQTNFFDLDCTSMIQTAITDGNYVNGFRFLENYMNSDLNHFNFLSFGARDSKGNGAPQLEITYSKIEDSTYQLCKQFISDTVVNPYRFGILGNWHIDRNYVYYSDRDERRENDLAIAPVNLRTDGTLRTFETFWTFNESGITPTTDESKWTWNVAENFFNKKGYEMENYDALNRFNSAQYGYSQQLSVAAAQNAKSREILFEGFEDYSYATSTCNYLCKDARTFDGLTITNSDSHTGHYSVHMPNGAEKTISVPLTNAADTATSLSIKVDSVLQYRRTVDPKGVGLLGTYVNHGCGVPTATRLDAQIDFYWAAGVAAHPDLCTDEKFEEITWVGKIQAPSTDVYTFYLDFVNGRSNTYEVSVNNRLVASSTLGTVQLALEIGKLYDIKIWTKTERWRKIRKGVRLVTDRYSVGIKASWSRTKDSRKVLIPQGALYPPVYGGPGNPPSYDTTGSFIEMPIYCVALQRIKPTEVLLPTFAPIKGVKTVISAWVKVENDHTNTADVNEFKPLEVHFEGAAENFALEPTGVRIEGWRRYQAVVVIPVEATQLKVVIKPGSKNILIDDFRLHPFNSNMKSFVYDQVSLKLMAELDENNYATFYEYDDAGSLMRLKKETERGVMTIKETRNNTQSGIQ